MSIYLPWRAARQKTFNPIVNKERQNESSAGPELMGLAFSAL